MVLPLETRRRRGVDVGSRLVLVEGPGAALLLSQAELLRRVRADFQGRGLVGELLAERREEAAQEDWEDRQDAADPKDRKADPA
jgi:hypothetical protein